MRKWTKATTGLLFLAAASVYPNQAGAAGAGKPADGAGPAKATPTVVASADDALGFAPDTPTTLPADGAGREVGKPFSININEPTDIVKVIGMLSIESPKNIIASKEVRGTITANLHDVTMKEALDAILKANGFAYREKGNFIYVYTAKELADIEKSERQLTTRVFPLHYTPAANAVTMIKPALSPEAQVSFTAPSKNGIESGSKEAGGTDHAVSDLVVVRDYEDNLKRVREILDEVDARPQQILIEATILRAALTDDNALGIDFTLLGGVDFASLSGAGQTVGGALSGSIIDNKDGGKIVDKGFAGGSTGFTSGTKGVPAGGLRIGFVKNNVAVFLSALEEATYTSILANPKVLALNKQRGEVIVGKKTGYLTTTIAETTSTQTVEFLETGTRLVFRPYIGDNGYIRMEVHPEDSDGGLVNNLPVKTTTEVTSNVMIKDGHTIVIGGLFRETNDVSRGQIPGLGNAPVIGPLFRRQADSVTREEIIILLTPHILKDDKAVSDAAEGALKDGEKLRVGVRRGMMCFSRERLAESSYECALSELNKPEPDRQKALWYLDCATNLRPTFLEAIDLKQKVTGKEITMSPGGSVRDFVKRQILAEQARTAPATRADAGAPAVTITPATQPTAALPATVPAAPTLAAGPATAPTSQPAVAGTDDDELKGDDQPLLEKSE